MIERVSVQQLCKKLLKEYLISVEDSPNKVSEDAESLAFSTIYLVSRYADEFHAEKWIDVFRSYNDQIGEIETYYRDMVVFQAPLWCCMYLMSYDVTHIMNVLDYGLSRSAMGRMIFLEYISLVVTHIDHDLLKSYVSWYCKEGKICVEPLLYLFMSSIGSEEDKISFIKVLYDDPDVRRYPQVPAYIEKYLNAQVIRNPFDIAEKVASQRIIDMILYRDLTMTKQLEIYFPDIE